MAIVLFALTTDKFTTDDIGDSFEKMNAVYAQRLGEARAIVPSAMKVGAFGSRLDVPIGHINAAYVRSHFNSMEVGIQDAPRPDEILFALVMGLVGGFLPAWAAARLNIVDGLRAA